MPLLIAVTKLLHRSQFDITRPLDHKDRTYQYLGKFDSCAPENWMKACAELVELWLSPRAELCMIHDNNTESNVGKADGLVTAGFKAPNIAKM